MGFVARLEPMLPLVRATARYGIRLGSPGALAPGNGQKPFQISWSKFREALWETTTALVARQPLPEAAAGARYPHYVEAGGQGCQVHGAAIGGQGGL